MQTSTLTRSIVTAVIAVAVALPVSPALGDVVLHRDGSKAVPFRAYPAASESSHVILHRDGSRADPFIADVAPTPIAAADSFDWGDAAVGAGAGLILALLGVAATGAYTGRHARTA